MSTPKSALHEAALKYAADGVPVFPCIPLEKSPATPRGLYDATTDVAQIDKWWSAEPLANVAASPAAMGLAVIDLDPGADLTALGELPITLNVTTPRGGKHLYYRGSLPPTSGRLATHVDTRGEKSYALLPPSATADGVYAWGDQRVAEDLPAWIGERLARAAPIVRQSSATLDAPVDVARARDYLHQKVLRAEVAVEGAGGNDYTYRLACELLNLGLSTECATDLLLEEWNSACVPPWETEELQAVVEHAASYAQNGEGVWAAGEPASKTFADNPAVQAAVRETPKPSIFEAEDEQENAPDPSWLVNGILPRGASVLLVGSSGSYKSFLALDVALSLTAGVPSCLGPVEPGDGTGTVFYATNEGRHSVKRQRRQAWKLGHGVEGPLDGYYVGPAPFVADPGSVQRWGDALKERAAGRPVRLIVLDTVAKCMAGLNENDARDVGIFVRFVDSLLEAFPGCTVMCLHHEGKNAEQGARGSSALVAGFDTYLRVKAEKGTRNVEVRVVQHKDAEERAEPWTAAGRVVGPSLAFFPTSRAEHAAAQEENDDFAPRKIGAALRQMGAFGADKSVTTQVLAAEVAQVRPNDTAEERAAIVAAATRTLARLARGRLEPYATGVGKGLAWYLPAP